MTSNIIKYSFLSALGVVLYVWGIASLLTHLSQMFPTDPNTVLVPMVMLVLFVISAATTGFFVLGRPIVLYMEGHKREGILQFLGTIIALAIFAVVLLSVLYIFA